MIKLLFSRSHLIGSYAIRALTWSDYSHVEFITRENELIGASFPQGVVRIPMAERVAKANAFEICTVTDADYDKALDFLNDQMGKPYDMTAIFGILTHRDWEEPDRWFCSELQAAAVKAGGVITVRKQGWRITPQDLLQSPCLT